MRAAVHPPRPPRRRGAEARGCARAQPELVRNEPYGFKSDIWALGCVAFEARLPLLSPSYKPGEHPFPRTNRTLSGAVCARGGQIAALRRPFEASNMSALVLMIVNAPPRAITRPPSRESEQLAQVRTRSRHLQAR